ncbi:RPA family protein [Halococcus thailandensis]|jgi:RPA family protein|uniref:Uncharacterized protein n=1 Tax=Halococcus thailandensis JCM 13552 TaxID=1227457 RepID=M0MTC2_9EURY|nr:hypothetical protein [Halococcus thailandensis]EMA48977.1 hypothetical protein C451_19673 [Halococcus thailandensis JCM 13552]
MSSNSEPTETTGREVARRVFAREFNDANYIFAESDDDMAPNYALLPTGEKANRVFFVGTLTETEDVGSDDEYWQARVVDPTGTFYVYAGQYQPEAARILSKLDAPEYVAVVGKPRTYETDDGTVNVAVRPESITVVDEETRERWVIETAEQTLGRLEHYNTEINDYARMVDERYTTSLGTYREEIIAALESLDETDTVDEADETDATDATGVDIDDTGTTDEDIGTSETDGINSDTDTNNEADSSATNDITDNEDTDETDVLDSDDETDTNADADASNDATNNENTNDTDTNANEAVEQDTL